MKKRICSKFLDDIALKFNLYQIALDVGHILSHYKPYFTIHQKLPRVKRSKWETDWEYVKTFTKEDKKLVSNIVIKLKLPKRYLIWGIFQNKIGTND